MTDKSTETPLSLEDAQTEANSIIRIKELGYAKQMIETQVIQSAQDKYKGTGETDLSSQILDSLKKSNPKLVDIINRQVDSISAIVNTETKYDEKFRSLSPDKKIESWDEKRIVAENTAILIGEKIKNLRVKSDTNISTPTAFGKVLDQMAEDRYGISQDDEANFGNYLNAVIADQKFETYIQNRGNKLNIKVDLNMAYKKQMDFNTKSAST